METQIIKMKQNEPLYKISYVIHNRRVYKEFLQNRTNKQRKTKKEKEKANINKNKKTTEVTLTKDCM